MLSHNQAYTSYNKEERNKNFNCTAENWKCLSTVVRYDVKDISDLMGQNQSHVAIFPYGVQYTSF